MLPFLIPTPAYAIGTPGPITSGYPTIASTTTYTSGSIGNPDNAKSSHNFNAPSGTSSGDLCLVFAAAGLNPVANIVPPSGYTTLASGSSSFNTRSYWCGYSTTENSIIGNFTVTGGSSEFWMSAVAYRITGDCDIESSTYATSSSGNPNSPSLATPVEWGVTPHVTWITTALKNYTSLGNPSGYGSRIGTANMQLYSARRELQAESEDPGAWSAPPSGIFWSAVTVAIRGPLA